MSNRIPAYRMHKQFWAPTRFAPTAGPSTSADWPPQARGQCRSDYQQVDPHLLPARFSLAAEANLSRISEPPAPRRGTPKSGRSDAQYSGRVRVAGAASTVVSGRFSEIACFRFRGLTNTLHAGKMLQSILVTKFFQGLVPICWWRTFVPG